MLSAQTQCWHTMHTPLCADAQTFSVVQIKIEIIKIPSRGPRTRRAVRHYVRLFATVIGGRGSRSLFATLIAIREADLILLCLRNIARRIVFLLCYHWLSGSLAVPNVPTPTTPHSRCDANAKLRR